MTAAPDILPAILDRIRQTLLGLRMPRAMEVLDQTVRQLECGQVSALEAIDTLLADPAREPRRARRLFKRSTGLALAEYRRMFQPLAGGPRDHRRP